MRTDGRMRDEAREFTLERDYSRYADGSVLVTQGHTRVVCTAMVEDGAPMHCRDSNMGWVTCEYCMLPSANPDRRSLQRPPGGRAREIQRFIGRSLRAAVDLGELGMRTIWIDCNVIQADGGTRTASVSAGFVALVDALCGMKEAGKIERVPLRFGVAAVSVGMVDGLHMLDLCAEEDRRASVDMNVVMTHRGGFVELQGTAEKRPYNREDLDTMLDLAQKGIGYIQEVQEQVLGGEI